MVSLRGELLLIPSAAKAAAVRSTPLRWTVDTVYSTGENCAPRCRGESCRNPGLPLLRSTASRKERAGIECLAVRRFSLDPGSKSMRTGRRRVRWVTLMALGRDGSSVATGVRSLIYSMGRDLRHLGWEDWRVRKQQQVASGQ